MMSITATPFTNASPVPRVQVVISDLPAGTVTLLRSAEGRTMAVRGGVRVSTTGGVVAVMDFECPFRTETTYKGEMFSPLGVSLGFTPTVTTMLHVWDYWIQQPLDPSLSVLLELRPNAAAALSRKAAGQVVYSQNALYGRYVGGTNRGLQGVSMDAVSLTEDESAMMRRIFGTHDTPQLPVVLIRSPPGLLRVPRVLFLAIPDPIEQDFTVRLGGDMTDWLLEGDEVLPPTPGLIVPILTWDDLAAAYPDGWDTVADTYADWVEASTDYTIAGAAG